MTMPSWWGTSDNSTGPWGGGGSVTFPGTDWYTGGAAIGTSSVAPTPGVQAMDDGYGSFVDRVKQSKGLRDAIAIIHPEWSAAEQAWQAQMLASMNITHAMYISDPANYSWERYDNQVWDAAGTYSEYQTATTEPTTPDTTGANTSCSNGICIVTDNAGNYISSYPDPSYVGPTEPGHVTDADNNAWQAEQARLQREAQAASDAANRAYQQQVFEYQRQQDAQQMAYQKAANTWTRFTDASGVWQKNQLGEIQRVGEVPKGVVQNLPETWAGWGKQWQQNEQYNPTSQSMDTIYGAAPLGYQETLAQGQWANQPGSWYDVALLNRTLNPTEQKYKTQVGNTVGALVSNRQGYDPRYDLQSGQAATGVTPGGWYDTSQNSNAWQQGYPASVGGTGNGEVGGYQTQIMNYGDYQNNPTGQAELSGWLNTGFSDYSEDEYLAKMNRLRAPSRYQGVSYR